MSSIDYMKRLALLILIFILSGLIYKILDFKFLGLTYIIVYVGAISILFLFVIMQTESARTPNLEVAPQNKGNFKNTYIKSTGIRLDIIALFLLLGAIIAKGGSKNESNSGEEYILNYFDINYRSSLISFTDIESLGYQVYLEYPFIIILIGILLWAILIGILRISQK